jgi:Na+-driven multidrug efflux pump
MIEGLLLRLLIGALVYWLGEKIIGLVKNADLVNILNVILIIAVVLYVIFGSILPIK